MEDSQAFLKAIHANPQDEAPYLIYSDWLREQGRDAEADLYEKMAGSRWWGVSSPRPFNGSNITVHPHLTQALQAYQEASNAYNGLTPAEAQRLGRTAVPPRITFMDRTGRHDYLPRLTAEAHLNALPQESPAPPGPGADPPGRNRHPTPNP